MKKLIAMALFFVSAMTMSAQSVTIIEQNSIKDTDIISALEDPSYALVDFSNPALKEAVDAINEQVKALTLDREGALDALDAAIIELEMKAGDFDLDGEFSLNDVQALLDAAFEDEEGFDYDGDTEFSLNDVQELLDMFFDM